MKINRLYIGIVFWTIYVLVMAGNSYVKTNAFLDKCNRVKGQVVDQIWVRKKAGDVQRPQVSYPVGDTSYLFVDHNVRLSTGEKPDVLYLKENPKTAQVYTPWLWIDLGDIVPSFLICILVFQIIWVLTHRFKGEVELLPSNF